MNPPADGQRVDDMISVAEAQAAVLAGVRPLSTEELSVAECFGRVLAKDIASRLTQPPVAVSSMDGYAVKAADVVEVPATLRLIGESAAGGGFDGTLEAGQTVRIFTGAPLPNGADAVVIQENTVTDGDKIIMKEVSPAGRYVRPAGLDFSVGDVLIKAGKRLNSRDVALIAGMNVPWVTVTRRPRVAILSTGNELVLPGEPLDCNQIISSNSIGLGAFITAAGGVPINLGIARDDAQSLIDKLDGISSMDMLITIGGASVGDYDLVKTVLGAEGMNITFSKVAMRPGKPLIFGEIQGTGILGLPGNPVSAGVTAALYLKPALEKMQGIERDNATAETAILGCDVGENDRRQDYLRSILSLNTEGELTATPFSKQDSSMLALFSKADCLVVRPPFSAALKVGARVEIIRLDPAA
ncbi:MAG: gephyrin-like molybdotransferase Glp [Pseudomonadota bacterium]|nr:gephyrin-like molybdotransferase Glp [Pseudomonadota bacterium]